MTPRHAACRPRRSLRTMCAVIRAAQDGRVWWIPRALLPTLQILGEVVTYNRPVADPYKSPDPRPGALASARTQDTARSSGDKVVCERCGTEMFRMHAVWRCPACGYKTDCCGW